MVIYHLLQFFFFMHMSILFCNSQYRIYGLYLTSVFITFEQYTTYIHCFHTSVIGRVIKILLNEIVKYNLLSVGFLAV